MYPRWDWVFNDFNEALPSLLEAILELQFFSYVTILLPPRARISKLGIPCSPAHRIGKRSFALPETIRALVTGNGPDGAHPLLAFFKTAVK